MNDERRPKAAHGSTAKQSTSSVPRTTDAACEARPPLYADPERERLFRGWQAGLRRRAACARRLEALEDDRPRYGDDLARREPWLRSKHPRLLSETILASEQVSELAGQAPSR